MNGITCISKSRTRRSTRGDQFLKNLKMAESVKVRFAFWSSSYMPKHVWLTAAHLFAYTAHTYAHKHTYTHRHRHAHTHTHAYIYKHTHAYKYKHTHAHMQIKDKNTIGTIVHKCIQRVWSFAPGTMCIRLFSKIFLCISTLRHTYARFLGGFVPSTRERRHSAQMRSPQHNTCTFKCVHQIWFCNLYMCSWNAILMAGEWRCYSERINTNAISTAFMKAL